MNTHYPENRANLTFLGILWRYKYHLVLYTISISFITFTVLYIFGEVPEELRVIDQGSQSETAQGSQTASSSQTAAQTASSASVAQAQEIQNTQTSGELPKKIIIDKIGVDTVVLNPTQTDNVSLNNALLKGAVRYPGSGTLGNGNMFLFGHSTGIRVVNNQAYKAFNHLNRLAIGDTIQVQFADKEYTYKVVSISLVDSDEALVDFSKKKDMLTLSTCNVFGEKQERYVVEALFVKSTPL